LDGKRVVLGEEEDNESEVWLFFKKVVWEKKQKTAKCDIPKCPHKPFSCGSGGSTNPLWRHLESSHWSQYVTTKEYRRKKKKVQNKHSNIEEIFERHPKNSTATTLTDINNVKLRNMFATWIINRQRPFSIIEDPELVEIIQYLNPKAQLVKADAIKNKIKSLYDLGKRELKANECWTLKETLIDFGLLNGKHDGMNISNGFFKVIKDYGIASK
ncbi:9822_t:CDS:2, partial [Dentiscutata heterogama]